MGESDWHHFWVQCGTAAGRRGKCCSMVDLPLKLMSLVTLSGGVSAGPGTGRGIVCLIAFPGLSHHVFGQIEK
eukprot:scaffold242473_cov70-Attheya_sp.AAC.1